MQNIPVKRGPKPKDLKGFDDLIKRVRSTISRNTTVSVVYVKNEGFKVVTKIRDYMQSLIDSDFAILVGVYQKGVLAQHLVEDFVFITDQVATGEIK
ncbi:MAG: hypothetical protein COB12_12510 [Flavobacterium sp.]|nr:MAG: hypothetical protein COB12_12510 [Flavobacterium sp.]